MDHVKATIQQFHKSEASIIIAGFIWGLSGFTLELLGDTSPMSQAILRMIFIGLSSVFILIKVPLRINKKYLFSFFALNIYFAIFILSILISNSSITYLLREFILILASVLIFILLTDSYLILSFIKGVYYALVCLVLFYFANINFAELFSPFYRLRTNLNPNGIGLFSVMLFVVTTYYNFHTKKKYPHISYTLIQFISAIVVVATRSRTALLLMIIAFFILAFLLKKKKIILIATISLSALVIYNFQTIDTIARLSKVVSKQKNISNLTGRTELWKKGILIIEKNWLIGVGPEYAMVKVDKHMGQFHNAYIQIMISGGILTIFPILVLVMMALARATSNKDILLFRIIFITGFLGSLVENRLLNFGSPANLLFLISFLALTHTTITDSSLKDIS